MTAKAVVLMEENIGANFCDLWLSYCLLDTPPKAQTIKEKGD